MQLIQVKPGTYINVHQIAAIKLEVKGDKCGATYQAKDKKFTVLYLSSGEIYRLDTSSKQAEMIKTLIERNMINE